ncbi:MAG: hypothetical protein F9K44_01485 [Hyphomicrobiaceae bacterium]|nr:MAG: hypothetical protein F9K44_01485 [Hyphomicrobiaceae bacterium]
MFQRGDVAEFIYRIQKAIGVKPDGDFDAGTEAALKRWQAARGLAADGIAGPATLSAMGLLDECWVENGDKAALVRGLQERLKIRADGRFGDQTESAIERFQKQNGLEIDGVAGPKTLAALGLLGQAGTPSAAGPGPRSTSVSSGAAARQIRSWAYQLSDIDPKVIAGLDVDLVVIDYSRDGEDATAFRQADLARLKQRPSGGRKLVIAYMSIGEAEDYRYYWRREWNKAATRPAWLDELNPDWDGNYKVRYWDPAWQSVILGSEVAYLDKIIAAGFDGVYLDIIDAFEYWEEKGEGGNARGAMIAFVGRIASYARARRPGFSIIPQNGEALLEDAGYRKLISAIGKEDIFYGADGDGQPNKAGEISQCLAHLERARAAGIPVLAIEYLDDPRQQAEAESRLSKAGCVAYFGPRDLDAIGTI